MNDENAFAVGLTCDGFLDMYVDQVSRVTCNLDVVVKDTEIERPVAIAPVVEHPDHQAPGRRLIVCPTSTIDDIVGTLDTDRMYAAVVDDARGLLALGAQRLAQLQAEH